MNTQMTTIEVDQNTAEILQMLKAKADAQGVTLDTLLQPLVENGGAQGEEKPFYETATPEEWVKAFREWVASHEGRGYGFVDDSRESIYTREDEAL